MDHLLEVTGSSGTPLAPVSLPELGLRERSHLQEWLIRNPGILGDDVLIVTAEYGRWEAHADGAPARDRLDVLGLDSTGRLVVVELKRDDSGRDVHLQAITYAALVSRFTLDTLGQAHQDFLARGYDGQSVTHSECCARLLAHVGGDLDPDVLQRPRIVLLAARFPKQVTHTAVWLSEMGLDIDLIQVSGWQVGDRTLAGFTKIYPTPEAEEFTLRPARQESEAVVRKVGERTRAKNTVHVVVNSGILPDGTRLRLNADHGATGSIRDQIQAWAVEDESRAWATWQNSTAKPLIWGADNQPYSPTGLANHIFTEVTGRTADGIQGPTWWVVEGIDDLTGLSLVDVASWIREADSGPAGSEP